MNTDTKFLGLDVKSPIVAASCGLTDNVDNLRILEDCGAGAVVLKSVFEEEIIYDIKRNTHIVAPVRNYGDSYEYVAQHVANNSFEQHLRLVDEAKRVLAIPVVASINCFSYENWVTYARQFAEAGVDGIEINMSMLPYEVSTSSDDVDRMFNNTINTLKKVTTLPIGIKVGPYFTDMAKFMQQLSWMGIQGIAMFNKALLVDIDVEQESLGHAPVLSHPDELYNTLRWVTILSKKLRCGISATTGVYSSDDVVKLLLAGAETVQVASCLYKNGVEYMKQLNDGLRGWMERKGYGSLADFRGKLAMTGSEKASTLLRTQFMKYYDEL